MLAPAAATWRRTGYHILQTIRVKHREHGVMHRWCTIRRIPSTHYRVTTSMGRKDSQMIYIRKRLKPDERHINISNALGLPAPPGKTVKAIVLLLGWSCTGG